MGINLDGYFSVCMANAIHDDTTSTISIGWGETFQPHFWHIRVVLERIVLSIVIKTVIFFAKSLDSIFGDNRV